MTMHDDSDSALDALLGRADEAVLTTVQASLNQAADPAAVGNEALVQHYTSLGSELIAARRRLPTRQASPWEESNGLLIELLEVLRQAADTTERLERTSAMFTGARIQLQVLAEATRRREADGRDAIIVLGEIRDRLGLIQRKVLLNLGVYESPTGELILSSFRSLDELLLRAHDLMVRLFADDGELAFFPLPAL